MVERMSQLQETDTYDSKSFQVFLDANQYTEEAIRRYEFMFGKTFVSTGGQATTEEFVKKLNLKPNDSVLDVGCGIGGSAFYMARQYEVKVHGLDLSTNMISIAKKYQQEMEEAVSKNVSFEILDVTKADLVANSLDVIYSRETLIHIADKESLFSNFLKWLKPGGKLLISDYSLGDRQEYSEDFMNYVRQRGYNMMKVADYGKLLEKVGFRDVVAENINSSSIEVLKTEAKRLENRREEFVARFGAEYFNYMVNAWRVKAERCSSENQALGLYTASC